MSSITSAPDGRNGNFMTQTDRPDTPGSGTSGTAGDVAVPSRRGSTVLVTGGAGFIGANLCERLLATESVAAVRVLDDLSNGLLENLDGLDVDLVEGSILDRASREGALRGASHVVHLAALGSVPRSINDPVTSHHANATGTLEILRGAHEAGARHVIVASSSSVYGANPVSPKVETLRPDPVSPYAVSKLATESYAVAFGRSYGLPTLATRFFNVFGPRQKPDHPYSAVIPIFTAAALRGQPLPVHGDGTQSRDFTFVDDLCGALVQAVEREVTFPGPVNAAFGGNIPLNEIITELERQLGRPLPREEHPTRVGDVPHSQADTARFDSLFPDAERTPFPDALATTVAWLRQRVAELDAEAAGDGSV